MAIKKETACRKRNISVKDCQNCHNYACYNLYGPIKTNGKLYKLIDKRMFTECKAHESCIGCDYINVCSSFVRQLVTMRPLDN